MNAKGTNMVFSSKVQETVLWIDNFKAGHFCMSQKMLWLLFCKSQRVTKGKRLRNKVKYYSTVLEQVVTEKTSEGILFIPLLMQNCSLESNTEGK